MYDLQKASLLKRFSAFLLDFILMTIALTGFAFLISVVTGYGSHIDTITEKRAYYEEKYSVDFDIDPEDYYAMPENEQSEIDDAYEIFYNDKEVIYAYNMTFNLTLIMITLSTCLSFLLLEFAIPMILKNGQTVGKKIFGIGIVHVNGVKMRGVALFARTLLGKCTIEVLVPVMILFTMLFGQGGVVGIAVLGLILVLEIFVFFKDKLHTPIHDVLSHTVCVDLASQMIFETEDELIAYKAKLHKETVDDVHE